MTFHRTGWSVSAPGDVNGGGLADVLVGAFDAASYEGRTYPLYSPTLNEAAAGNGDIDLVGLTPAQVVVLEKAPTSSTSADAR